MRGGDEMTKYILSLFLSLSLMIGSAVSFAAFAQTDTGPGLQNPGNVGTGVMNEGDTTTTTDDTNTFEPGVGGGPGDTATAGGTNNGLNWLWLLPLLAIPVLYFVWRSSDETTRSRGYRE